MTTLNRPVYLLKSSLGRTILATGLMVMGWSTVGSAQTIKDAQAALAARNYDQAITGLRSILSGNPKDADAHYLLGLALKGKGQKEEALAEFEAAVGVRKKHVDALYELSMLQIEMKQLDGATQTLAEGDKQTKGKDGRFAFARGQMLVAQGDLAEAKNVMTLAVSADPSNPMYQRGLGDVYMAMKVWALAAEAYKKALAMQPNSPNAAFTHYQLGKLYFELRQFDQAANEYKLATDLDPTLKDAWYQQGWLRFLAKQYVAAVEPLEQAVKLDSKNAEANFMLAESLNKTQRIKMAVPYYEATLAVNPDKMDAYAPLADGYLAMGEYSKAVQAYEKAVQRNPNDGQLVYSLGWVQTQADVGQYDKGIVNLKKAIQLDPASEKPHIQLALVYFDQEKYADALPHLKKAIELNPGDQNPYAYYGRAFIKQKQYAEAVAAVKSALEPVMAKKDDQTRLKLSSVYFTLGQDLYTESRGLENKDEQKVLLMHAIEMYKAKVAYDSTSYSTYLNMGLAGLVAGDGAIARDALLKATELRKDAEDPKSTLSAWKYLGTSYLILEDWNNARKTYEHILTINPEDDDAYYRLGYMSVIAKNFNSAVDHLRKAVGLKPDNAGYHLLLAQAYTNAQQLQNAIREYSEVLRIDPNNGTARSQLETVRKALEQQKGNG